MAKPLISADHIYAAALGLLAEEGITALTARNLTARLHCSAKTLYQQVGNREQMLRGLVAYAFEEIELDFTRGGTWQSSVSSWCLALRDALLARPALGALMSVQDRDVVVRYVNRLVKVLVEQGFTRALAVKTCRVLSHATLSMTLAELAEPGARQRPDYFPTALGWFIQGIEGDLELEGRVPARSSARGKAQEPE
jgi:AcrR family transcriptional regulator